MSSRQEKKDAKRAARVKNEERLAQLEGLIRMGQTDAAVRFLMREEKRSRSEAEKIVARYSGAIGPGRHQLNQKAKVAAAVVFIDVGLWVITMFFCQRVWTTGYEALVVNLVRWSLLSILALILIGAGAVAAQTKKSRIGCLLCAAIVAMTAWPPFGAVVGDLFSEPVTRTMTVSAEKHYGDPRIELVPQGEKSSRTWGHFVSRKDIATIKGVDVQLTYWPRSGVVKEVQETKN